MCPCEVSQFQQMRSFLLVQVRIEESHPYYYYIFSITIEKENAYL